VKGGKNTKIQKYKNTKTKKQKKKKSKGCPVQSPDFNSPPSLLFPLVSLSAYACVCPCLSVCHCLFVLSNPILCLHVYLSGKPTEAHLAFDVAIEELSLEDKARMTVPKPKSFGLPSLPFLKTDKDTLADGHHSLHSNHSSGNLVPTPTPATAFPTTTPMSPTGISMTPEITGISPNNGPEVFFFFFCFFFCFFFVFSFSFFFLDILLCLLCCLIDWWNQDQYSRK